VARAPAKVILVGEHWVVHGGRAVAAAIGLYAVAQCKAKPGDRVIVRSRELGVEEELDRCRDLCNLAAAWRHIAARHGFRGAVCELSSDIPPGAGLGSSAAVAAAFAAAYLCVASGGVLDRELVNRAAFEAEKITHGNPSGIDNTVSVYGGIVVYRRGREPRRVRASTAGSLLVVNTGIERSTRVAVEKFSARLASLPGSLAAEMIRLNDIAAGYAVRALREGDYGALGRVMNLSHGLLQSMGVSLAELDTIVELLRDMGVYGAKLSGAGLGGVVIAVAEENAAERIAEELRRRGYDAFRAVLPAPGVRVQTL